jgi:hypothetical protein
VNVPLELHLDHPIEVDNIRYDKLTLTNFSALANFQCNSPERIILSLARTFNVPRRTIRHLHPDDAIRAGDLICALLDETTRSLQSFE